MSLTTYLDSSIEHIAEADDNDDISNKSEENKREFGYEIKIGSSMKFPFTSRSNGHRSFRSYLDGPVNEYGGSLDRGA